MMRPSTLGPTGTEMALPVFATVKPRRKPSDAPIAIVRTTPSPSCCCTSSVRSTSVSFSASYTCGMESRGNETSMTGPMIWMILPVAILLFPQEFCTVLDRCRAAHDFRELGGNRRLACLVVDELQLVDELAGVVCCSLHRDHARCH